MLNLFKDDTICSEFFVSQSKQFFTCVHAHLSALLVNTILNLTTMHPVTCSEYTVAVRNATRFTNNSKEFTLFTLDCGFYSLTDVVLRRNLKAWKVTGLVKWQ